MSSPDVKTYSLQETSCSVVCNDAGSTNILFSWLKRKQVDFKIYTEGPATRLWQLAFPGAANRQKDFEDALECTRTLITGADWSSDLTHRARQHARERNIRTVALLDHWVNYKERFTWNGNLSVPDEVWVADGYAYLKARREFPNIKIQQIANYYLQEEVEKVKSELKAIDDKERNSVLYILEPIRMNWGSTDNPGEFQALDYFLENRLSLGLDEESLIVLRPHPSDPTDKYHHYLLKGGNIVIDDRTSLSKQIARANLVVGCESAALVIALEAGVRVLSTNPPGAPNCRLPHKEIQHFRDVCNK